MQEARSGWMRQLVLALDDRGWMDLGDAEALFGARGVARGRLLTDAEEARKLELLLRHPSGKFRPQHFLAAIVLELDGAAIAVASIHARGIHVMNRAHPGGHDLPPARTVERKRAAAGRKVAEFSRVVVAAGYNGAGVACTLIEGVATRLHAAGCIAMFPGELGLLDPKGWVLYDGGKSKAWVWKGPCLGLDGNWYGFEGGAAWARAPAPEPSACAELLLRAPAPGVAPGGFCPACREHKEVGWHAFGCDGRHGMCTPCLGGLVDSGAGLTCPQCRVPIAGYGGEANRTTPLRRIIGERVDQGIRQVRMQRPWLPLPRRSQSPPSLSPSPLGLALAPLAPALSLSRAPTLSHPRPLALARSLCLCPAVSLPRSRSPPPPLPAFAPGAGLLGGWHGDMGAALDHRAGLPRGGPRLGGRRQR
jgi:hypothetical protein